VDLEEEKTLVHRMKNGDDKAFSVLVRHYQNKIYSLVFRMLADAEEAEDLAQDIFITLYTSIDTFREESRLSTWLYRIAVNLCRNRIKYLSRRRKSRAPSLEERGDRGIPQDAFPGSPVLVSRLPRPDRLAEGRQMEAIIQEALAALDPEQRELIVLRDIQGMSYSEMERIVGLPLGTIKSRLHRARMSLKDKVSKDL